MSKLKPCPFCGSEDILEQDPGMGIPYMLCNNCHARGPKSFAPALQWNTRAESAELAALREQINVLREAMGKIAECCDGCTCGDGWSHDIAIEALEQTKPKGGE